MHYHLEIIMPPTNDVEGAINKIMAPFYEGSEDTIHKFWDWYQIGGRYSGEKITQSLNKATLDLFYEWCSEQKIIVHGVRAGKQEIAPATQIEKVDSKWNEMFPTPNGEIVPCPLFQHAGPRLNGDILPLSQSKHAEALSVIIASTPHKELEVTLLLHKEIWNGVTHQTTDWDGTIASALELQERKLVNYKDEYREAVTPKDDWMVVTVDYHS